jgi:hypothetical protein
MARTGSAGRSHPCNYGTSQESPGDNADLRQLPKEICSPQEECPTQKAGHRAVVAGHKPGDQKYVEQAEVRGLLITLFFAHTKRASQKILHYEIP